MTEQETKQASRAERKERTRQRLLDATLALVTKRSLASVSLRPPSLVRLGA